MRALCVLLVLATSCHHDGDSAGGPPPTADQDALWKLAPDGTKLGIVVSSRGLTMLEHAATELHAFMAKAPELAPLAAKLDAALQGHPLELAAYGLAPGKGAAAFFIDGDKGVIIVPLADRDKFLAAVHGTKGDKLDTIDKHTVCATTHGVYACGPDAAMFDRLGKGAHPPDAGARGDIEVFSDHFADSPVMVAITAQLHRGGFTAHGSIAGIPGDKLAMLGGADKPRLDGDRTTGFAVAHVKPLFDFVARNEQSQRALAASLGDPLTVTMEASSYDAQLPLVDPSIVKMFLDSCADGPLAALGAKLVDGKCHVVVPNAPGMALDGWLEGNTLHIAQQGAPGPSVPLTRLGKELADQSWQLAFYGHGSLLAASALYGQMARQIPPEVAPYLKMALRGLIAFEELGAAARVENGTLKLVVGVRTIWDNPDDVVAKIAAIDPDTVIAGTAGPAVKAITDAAPDSPFTGEVRAGYGGLMIETMGVGMAAAVAIPAFIDYMKRSKQTEAALNLNKIGKNAKRAFGDTGSFPAGTAALLPAAAPVGYCCGGVGGYKGAPGPSVVNKCTADPAAFRADPTWAALEMSVDEPSQYQYSYTSDGKTFTATAIGDVDCDGTAATWTLQGTITAAGNPQTNLIPPPTGVY